MPRKKVTLEEVLRQINTDSYDEQYHYVVTLVNQGILTPVKAAAKNGKKPALFTRYWISLDASDDSDAQEEMLYRLNPAIKISWYQNHPDVYKEEREAVLRFSTFLNENKDLLNDSVSYNERSFQMFQQEKYLLKTGITVLKHCGFELQDLNCYPTAEPFSYFALSREVPQNILILENKDPYFGMRRYLLEGGQTIFGTKIGTLIYGAGKRVISSFREFEVSAEPYMKDERNTMLYFGDLDYEGIGIYESLKNTTGMNMIPFTEAYKKMIDKGKGYKELPFTKENQNRNISTDFYSYFDQETVAKMNSLLSSDRYIPQEILNISDY